MKFAAARRSSAATQKIGLHVMGFERLAAVAMLTFGAISGGAVHGQTNENPPPVFAESIVPVDPYAQTASMHRGVNVLGNDPVWDDPARARFKIQDFAKIHDAGFDTVRLALKPIGHTDAEGRLDSVWLATLDGLVTGALAAGLTPILDLHYAKPCDIDPSECERTLTAFWRQIAARYRDAPARVLFEILNEPHDALTPPVWNRIYRVVLAAIRETNPVRNVIVAPANWSSVGQLNTLGLPPDDQHLIVTVHYYSPLTFTHQGAPWVESTKNLSGITFGTPADWQRVYRDFDGVRAWSDAQHRPVLLGEFGAYEKADLGSRMRYDSYVARAAEMHGFPWTYWQFDSDFIVYDVDRDSWVQPILNALIPPGGNGAVQTR
jgi:endoglucanase